VPACAFTVPRAAAEDAQPIGAVVDAAVSGGLDVPRRDRAAALFSAQDWNRLVADHAPPNAPLVAVDAADRVLGFTAVHPRDGELFLPFVDPAHAGRGVGRALLDAAHDVLRAAGRRAALLFTEEHNSRARAVYAAAGYRPDGTVRESELHGTPVRELRPVKRL
jgi:GNAT superfamily N-acetyltransferase